MNTRLKEIIRQAGGIVHSDGNIFFTTADQFSAAASALPAVEAVTGLSEATVKRLQDAIEGECDGLAVDAHVARDILRYVGGLISVQSCCGRRECGGECGGDGETEWVADPSFTTSPPVAAPADGWLEKLTAYFAPCHMQPLDNAESRKHWMAGWNARGPAAPADGFKLVPVEPTEEMVDAFHCEDGDGALNKWAAMLAAASTPAAATTDGAAEVAKPQWKNFEAAMADPFFHQCRAIQGTGSESQDRALFSTLNHFATQRLAGPAEGPLAAAELRRLNTPEPAEAIFARVLAEAEAAKPCSVSPVDAIEFRRDAYGFTQTQMAQVIGMSKSHYSEVVNGRRELPKAAMRRAVAIGVPAITLLGMDAALPASQAHGNSEAVAYPALSLLPDTKAMYALRVFLDSADRMDLTQEALIEAVRIFGMASAQGDASPAHPDAAHGPMTEAPEVGARYWGITGGYVWKQSWDDARYEYARLQAGELFRTEADARAALQAEKGSSA